MKLGPAVVVDHAYNQTDPQAPLLYQRHPASRGSVAKVLAADVDSNDGRSEWLWIRLPDGTLFLGVAPQGETYEEVEEDAAYPADTKAAQTWTAEKRWNNHSPSSLQSWLAVNGYSSALAVLQWDDVPADVQRRYEMDSRP